MALARTLAAHFEKNTIPEPMSGCLLWIGDHARAGYGRLRIGGKRLYAHRLAWEMAHGPIPAGLSALHHCDNPACVNMEARHIFLGTQKDNVVDMIRKGRDRGASTEHRTASKCKYGHAFGSLNVRIGVGGRRHCVTCEKAYHERRRQEQAALLSEQNRSRYEANREERLARARAYHAANREKRATYDHAYYLAHRKAES